MEHRYVSRRAVLAGSTLAVGSTLAGGTAVGAPARPDASARSRPDASARPRREVNARPRPDASARPRPAAALGRLLAGNRRFAGGRCRHPRQDLDTVRRLANRQDPYAVVLGCADSRVPPEVLFDQGLGDVFDNRLAGNLVDDLILASVEFAVGTFHSPVVVVLGHERCGAITATIDAIEGGRGTGTEPRTPRRADPIVDALRPIVAPALALPGDPVENAVRANVRAQARRLVRRSPLLTTRVTRGDLLVVGARYDLDDARVTLLG